MQPDPQFPQFPQFHRRHRGDLSTDVQKLLLLRRQLIRRRTGQLHLHNLPLESILHFAHLPHLHMRLDFDFDLRFSHIQGMKFLWNFLGVLVLTLCLICPPLGIIIALAWSEAADR